MITTVREVPTCQQISRRSLAWETSWVDKVMAGDFDNLRYRATMLLKKTFVQPSSLPNKRASATDLQSILRNNLSSSSILDCHADTHSHEAAGSALKKVKIEPGVFKSLSSVALDSAIDVESSPEKSKHASSGSASQSLTQGLEEELRL